MIITKINQFPVYFTGVISAVFRWLGIVQVLLVQHGGHGGSRGQFRMRPADERAPHLPRCARTHSLQDANTRQRRCLRGDQTSNDGSRGEPQKQMVGFIERVNSLKFNATCHCTARGKSNRTRLTSVERWRWNRAVRPLSPRHVGILLRSGTVWWSPHISRTTRPPPPPPHPWNPSATT